MGSMARKLQKASRARHANQPASEAVKRQASQLMEDRERREAARITRAFEAETITPEQVATLDTSARRIRARILLAFVWGGAIGAIVFGSLSILNPKNVPTCILCAVVSWLASRVRR